MPRHNTRVAQPHPRRQQLPSRCSQTKKFHSALSAALARRRFYPTLLALTPNLDAPPPVRGRPTGARKIAGRIRRASSTLASRARRGRRPPRSAPAAATATASRGTACATPSSRAPTGRAGRGTWETAGTSTRPTPPTAATWPCRCGAARRNFAVVRGAVAAARDKTGVTRRP